MRKEECGTKRMELNRDTINKLRWLIVFTVVVVVTGVNYRKLLELLGSLVHIASPFILGAAIAFVLNVPMRNIERHLPWKGKLEKRIIGFPEGDGAGVHFHCPPCLSDACSFMTDCIRPDRTSVADMWTIENVLRLRLHAGGGE